MKRFGLILILCLSVIINCDYNDNKPQKKDKEVKELALKTYNISTRLVRVKSTIGWVWKDSSGFEHAMDAGEFALDNVNGKGKIQITDDPAVLVENLSDYYEKKNSSGGDSGSVGLKIDESLSQVNQCLSQTLNSGTYYYFNVSKPVLMRFFSTVTTPPTLSPKTSGGYVYNMIEFDNSSKFYLILLPVGKYKFYKSDGANASAVFISLSSDVVSTCIAIGTTAI